MKIDEFVGSIIDKYKNVNTNTIKKTKNVQTKGTKINSNDTVQISKEARQLISIDNHNIEHLESVKRAIENGTYNPPLNKIANSILKEWSNE